MSVSKQTECAVAARSHDFCFWYIGVLQFEDLPLIYITCPQSLVDDGDLLLTAVHDGLSYIYQRIGVVRGRSFLGLLIDGGLTRRDN